MAGTVLVTGGTGYIAGELIDQLLAQGWCVRTTARSKAKSEPGLRARSPNAGDQLYVFEADLTSDAGWDLAAEGCTHVAHLASPLPASKPRHEDELIVPAREGALRALRAAKGAGVKRFVMTSSMAAIAYGHPRSKTIFNEADWTDVTSGDAYAYVKSKTIAERAARDWVAAEGEGIEFVTVNPSLVIGPVHGSDYSTSVEAIKKLLEGSMPGLPNFGFGVVDVRDVADMHVRCLTAPDMAGERFICSGPWMTMADIARVLREGLGGQARKVPTRRLPDWVVRIAALFDPVVRQVIGELGNTRESPADHAREKLGWVPRPVEESILDTAHSLIAHGVVKV